MSTGEDLPGGAGDQGDVQSAGGAVGRPMLEISNAVVHLYKEAFGRGPTFITGIDTQHDVAVETFTLEPTNEADVRRLDR